MMLCDDVMVVRGAWPRLWGETKVVLVVEDQPQLQEKRVINRVNVPASLCL